MRGNREICTTHKNAALTSMLPHIFEYEINAQQSNFDCKACIFCYIKNFVGQQKQDIHGYEYLNIIFSCIQKYVVFILYHMYL